jgi:rare lipoprotein A
MKQSVFIWLLICFFSFSAIGKPGKQFKRQGKASFYASKFHGRTTANGERYNMNAYTAAHKTLPFNTLVKVVNLKNNKSVLVRINDRGPYAKGRIIDLSKSAAKTIGLYKAGSAYVRIEVVEHPQPEVQPELIVARDLNFPATAMFFPGNIYNIWGMKQPNSPFNIHISTYLDLKRAREEAIALMKLGVKNVSLEVVDNGGTKAYRLLVTSFTSKSEAEKALADLLNIGVEGYVRKVV